jgi:phosphoglucosamine mutase
MAEMWTSGKTLHELKKGMEKYPQCLINVRIRERVNIDSVGSVQKVKDAIQRELNGTGRVLLRPSGTEPLIRVMVEGRDLQQVQLMANRLADAVGKALPT